MRTEKMHPKAEPLLDHGYIKLVETWGKGETGIPEAGIIEAARQSTQGNFRGWAPYGLCLKCEGWIVEGADSEHFLDPQCDHKWKRFPRGDEGLLSFLFTNKPQHATPFEFAGLTIEVQAPIFVFREWHRHRTQCLSGNTMITCVSPRGTSYQRSIRSIFELKYGGVQDARPTRHRNGTSRAGTPVTRAARHKDPWRTRILPNCQQRMLRVLNEATGDFEVAPMADVWESGVKTIYRITTNTGRTIEASAEHPFFTKRGWVKLKELKKGDLIARLGKVAAGERIVPPALRTGIGVWTSMMRKRLIKPVDTCYLCGTDFKFALLELDHVVPVAADLLLALDARNLRPVCGRCHKNKSAAEQPSRDGMTKRGVVWEEVVREGVRLRDEMTYDIEVGGPHHNYVANGFVVHNSYNEMSARYAPLPAFDYTPTLDRVMMGGAHAVATTNRQAQAAFDGVKLTADAAMEWLRDLERVYDHVERVYQRGLKIGIPKELARCSMVVARYSRMRASANLRNWLAFMTLRADKGAQWEIRMYAQALGRILEREMPRTWKLYDLARAT